MRRGALVVALVVAAFILGTSLLPRTVRDIALSTASLVAAAVVFRFRRALARGILEDQGWLLQIEWAPWEARMVETLLIAVALGLAAIAVLPWFL